MKKKEFLILFLCLIIITYASAQWTNIPDSHFEQALIDLGLDDIQDGKVLTESIVNVEVLLLENKGISNMTGIQSFINLKKLYARGNNISAIDLSCNLNLTELAIGENPLSNLDLSNQKLLTHISCENTNLNSLHFPSNNQISHLFIQRNKLKNIDVSMLHKLYVFLCSYNEIEILDVTQNSKLTFLEAAFNKLMDLRLSNNPDLKLIVCANNNLKSLNIKNGFNYLISTDYFYAFGNPNLTCIEVDDPAWSSVHWTNIDPQMYFSMNCGVSGNDLDGDGVPDYYDDYPNDPHRAFNNYFPASSFGSLAFEDLWPGTGDYDFNDVVVDYRFQIVTNASNRVAEIFGKFVLKASGASLHNGFGFNLPMASQNLISNIDQITVSGYSVKPNFISLNQNGLENGQSKPTIIIFDDFFNVMTHPGMGIGINTELDKPFVAFDTVNIHIKPSSSQFTLKDFMIDLWNPFIIVNGNRCREIHLPNQPPTDLADISIFGTFEDSSNPASGRYYKTRNNLPWAIHIFEEFTWPVEKVNITEAYKYFLDWAKSSGLLYPDWYKNIPSYRDTSKLYIRHK